MYVEGAWSVTGGQVPNLERVQTLGLVVDMESRLFWPLEGSAPRAMATSAAFSVNTGASLSEGTTMSGFSRACRAETGSGLSGLAAVTGTPSPTLMRPSGHGATEAPSLVSISLPGGKSCATSGMPSEPARSSYLAMTRLVILSGTSTR